MLTKRPYPRDEYTFICTYTGRKYWPLNPHPDDVCIEDIAHHLALVNRFTGATREPYSVAEHSIRVSNLVGQSMATLFSGDSLRLVALCGLLHDASEAYLQDIARPFKHSPAMEGYRKIEALNERVISEAFGLPFPWPPVVKRADNILLATEMRDLLPFASAPDGIAILPDVIEPMSWREAEFVFLQTFKDLC